jgi:type III pantothenate kinase
LNFPEPKIHPGTVLAIDAGNTRVKWGVHDGSAWRAMGAVETADARTLPASLAAALPAQAAIASNVAGAAVQAAIEHACAQASLPVRFIRGEASRLGVTSAYRDPAQLGSDRWIALVAAHAARPGHKLVINAGTAVTIDALTADGRFLGGVIVPGPALMRRSLDHGTSALRESPGELRDFPDNTPDAIATGTVIACAGAADRMARAMNARGTPPGLIILSGGAARELAPALGLPHEIHQTLVLDGLQLIARSA